MKTCISHHLQLTPLELIKVDTKCIVDYGKFKTNTLTVCINKSEVTYFLPNSELLKVCLKKLIDSLTTLYHTTFEDTDKDEELPNDQPF